MRLVNVKLRNGTDLVGHLIGTDNYSIEIQSPITIEISPQFGIFASNYLMFSNKSSIRLQNHDFVYCTDANKRAIDYYEEFINRHNVTDSDAEHEKLTATIEAAHVKYKH